MGREIAIDATDLPAYANGQKYDGSGERKKPFSDPDAAWGFRSAVSTRRGGGFYGYKLHAAACSVTGLPLAWRIESGNRQETGFALPLLDAVKARGFEPEACAFDKGYDHRPNYEGCEARGVRPIIPLRKIGKDSQPLACEHGASSLHGGGARLPGTCEQRHREEMPMLLIPAPRDRSRRSFALAQRPR